MLYSSIPSRAEYLAWQDKERRVKMNYQPTSWTLLRIPMLENAIFFINTSKINRSADMKILGSDANKPRIGRPRF
jgi:hypothetical protein